MGMGAWFVLDLSFITVHRRYWYCPRCRYLGTGICYKKKNFIFALAHDLDYFYGQQNDFDRGWRAHSTYIVMPLTTNSHNLVSDGVRVTTK